MDKSVTENEEKINETDKLNNDIVTGENKILNVA